MDDAEMGPCSGAGWTLIMKINGTKVRYSVSFLGFVYILLYQSWQADDMNDISEINDRPMETPWVIA